MSLNESTVELAALEWIRLRYGFGGQVGELGYAVGHGPQMARWATISVVFVDLEVNHA